MHTYEEMLYAKTSLEEVFWGLLLIAFTMWLHSIGMQLTMATDSALREGAERRGSFQLGVGTIVAASLVIVSVHLLEVLLWAAFLVLSDAIPNSHAAVYFSLMQYTTVGSNFSLPDRWRLLEGMIAIAGLMTFAWSTGVLFTLAQEVLLRQRQHAAERHQRKAARSGARPPDAD